MYRGTDALPPKTYVLVQIRGEASTDEGPGWLVEYAARRAAQAKGTAYIVVGPEGIVHREPIVPSNSKAGVDPDDVAVGMVAGAVAL